MTYIDDVRKVLEGELPGMESPLADLYLLLTLVKGEDVTLENVHDAWSVWMSRMEPEHRSLMPFELLTPEVQQLDKKYADGISAAAAKQGVAG